MPRTPIETYAHLGIDTKELDSYLGADRQLIAYAIKENHLIGIRDESLKKKVSSREAIDKLDTQIMELEAKLSVLERERREQRGVFKHALFHESLAEKGLNQLDNRWKKRELFLAQQLVFVRLNALRKELNREQRQPKAPSLKVAGYEP